MVHDQMGFSVAWWQLAMVANGIVSIAYLAIYALILVPTARSGQLRSNRRALATVAAWAPRFSTSEVLSKAWTWGLSE